MQTGKIVKAEALIRWDQPLRGRVNPGDFIPLAEESGMIVPLGNWIFNEAMQQLAAWRTQYRSDFSLSVNVSPVQLLRKSCKTLRNVWYMSACNGILTGHEAKQP